MTEHCVGERIGHGAVSTSAAVEGAAVLIHGWGPVLWRGRDSAAD